MNSKYSEAQAIALQTPLPSGRVTAAIAIACLVAIASSGYLGWVTLTSSKIAGCGGGDLFNCGHVTSSQWSLWLGIPVSLLAVGLYIGLGTALAAGARKSFSNEFRHAAWAVVSILAIAAGLAALWFIGLQVFVLQQLCTYCLIAHTCSLIIAGLILYTRPVGTPALKYSSLVSLMGAAVLIGGQLLAEPPKTYRVETFEAPVVEAEVFEFSAPVTPSSTTPESGSDEFSIKPISSTDIKMAIATILRPSTLARSFINNPASEPKSKPAVQETAARRLVPINGGTLKLDVTQWPVSGSIKAKYIFAEMFDYSCPHCRRTHAAIKEATTKLKDDVAVMVLPVPLSTGCNDTIKTTGPKFTESCEIAKLAIAVWRADSEKFYDFHNWMFSGETPPTYAAAKAHADTLVDSQKLDADLASDVPAQYIAKTVELYKRAGKGDVPKLIFPTTSIVGEFTSGDSLVQVMQQQIK